MINDIKWLVSINSVKWFESQSNATKFWLSFAATIYLITNVWLYMSGVYTNPNPGGGVVFIIFCITAVNMVLFILGLFKAIFTFNDWLNSL